MPLDTEALLAKSDKVSAELKAAIAQFQAGQAQFKADLATLGHTSESLKSAMQSQLSPQVLADLNSQVEKQLADLRRAAELKTYNEAKKQTQTPVKRKNRQRLVI